MSESRFRKEWQEIEFYQELFQDKKINWTDNRVLRLQRRLNNLSPRDEYNVIAYGSLMNEDDIPRTLARYEIQPGFIKGYRRIFNMGRKSTGSFLNITKEGVPKEHMMPVAIITIPFTEMPGYLLRESWYEAHLIEAFDEDGLLIDDEAITVVCDSLQHGLEPQLNYVHLCMSGIIDLYGANGANDFLENTLCYNPKIAGLDSLKNWMKDLNVADLMIRQNYIRR